MAKAADTNKYISVGSLFKTGEIKRMKDIDTLYPTLIAKSLGINYSRYIQKLHHPEEFTLKQVMDLARLLDINPSLIIDVILKQPVSRKKTG